MFIEQLVVGPYQTNCYILGEEKTKSAWIIDPGAEAEAIISKIEEREVLPVAVLLTHAHWDHITALPALVKEYGELEIFVGENDRNYLGKGSYAFIKKACNDNSFLNMFDKQLSMLPDPTTLLSGRQFLQDCRLLAIPSPGHTPGGFCYYSEEGQFIFTGDTLFAGSIGRTDLYGGDYQAMLRSCMTLMDLEDDVQVLPGHGPQTTIGRERRYNPYCQGNV
ncbi:MAG: MBL fold metallo-hydrolase [Spirochaetia bacterium]|jgi:glyoxylase-like metal-dependent hydrolase (beta-lactamase superfamily II)|nr:MBL fold metallo-hydrolase [Spirochaetia bacterium]